MIEWGGEIVSSPYQLRSMGVSLVGVDQRPIGVALEVDPMIFDERKRNMWDKIQRQMEAISY